MQDIKEVWNLVWRNEKNLDSSDRHFMLAIGWNLGLVSNPGPSGKVRTAVALDSVDIQRLLTLYKGN